MSGWQNRPFAIDVEAGDTKAFCLCGQTQNAPFCDGSHKTTELRPCVEKFDAAKKVFVCGCRQTGTPPYCDGTHKTLPAE